MDTKTKVAVKWQDREWVVAEEPAPTKPVTQDPVVEPTITPVKPSTEVVTSKEVVRTSDLIMEFARKKKWKRFWIAGKGGMPRETVLDKTGWTLNPINLDNSNIPSVAWQRVKELMKAGFTNAGLFVAHEPVPVHQDPALIWVCEDGTRIGIWWWIEK